MASVVCNRPVCCNSCYCFSRCCNDISEWWNTTERDRLAGPFVAADWLVKHQHCLFAGHHWDFGTHSGGNCVSRISYGIPDYVVSYSICCAYDCCSVCLCSLYTRRISSAFRAWCGLRIFICSNSQPSNSYCNTRCLELWSNIVANFSSDARVWYQGDFAGILKI